MAARAVDVALPLPVQTTFTYRVPDERGRARARRARARAVRPRRVIGLVTGASAGGRTSARSRTCSTSLDEVPLVPPPLLDLAAWVADHYLAPPGECYRLVAPAGGRAGQPRRRPARPAARSRPPTRPRAARRCARRAAAALDAGAPAGPRSDGARLRACGAKAASSVEQDLARVRVPPGADRRARAERRRAAARNARRRGARAPARGRRPGAGRRPRARPALAARRARRARRAAAPCAIDEERAMRTPEGAAARPSLRPAPDRATSSARCEPILAAVEARPLRAVPAPRRHRQRQDRGLLPRRRARARAGPRRARSWCPRSRSRRCCVRAAAARFGATVAVLHSELSAGERHDQWWRIREGEARVVVGARSAVFAPLPDARPGRRGRGARGRLQAGGEPALPRARRGGDARHAWRARRSCSARPRRRSSPTRNARKGKYRLLVAAHAHRARSGLPRVEVVDRRAGPAQRAAIRSSRPPLREALAERPGAARAGAAAAQPARLRHEPALPRVRAAGRRAPTARCALTLHQRRPRRRCATTAATRRRRPRACALVQGRIPAPHRLRHREGAWRRCRPRCPSARVERLDRDLAARRGAVAARAGRLRGGGDRHPGGHADDRQGPRLPARHAGGRDRRRRRARACPTSAPPSGRSSSSPRWRAAPAAPTCRAR